MVRSNPHWIHISYIKEITDDIQLVNCDTRDFCVIRKRDKVTKEYDKSLYRRLHGEKINEKFLIKGDQIIPFLQGLERMSGGLAGWRCLNFTSVKTRSGWLKYILFARYRGNLFVVIDDDHKLIDPSLCVEEHLEKEFLNTH